MAPGGFKIELGAKVGWVLKNSGNFQSNEHKDSLISSKNGWEKWGQSCLPHLKINTNPAAAVRNSIKRNFSNWAAD